MNLLRLLKEEGAGTLTRNLLIKEFNASFYNKMYYSSRPRNTFLAPHEDNLVYKDAIVNEVLTLCSSTEMYKTYGISFNDLINMDFVVYDQVKEYVLEDTERRQKALTKTHDSLQKETTKLRRM